MLIIKDIKCPLNADASDIKKRLAQKLKIRETDIYMCQAHKRSLDARQRNASLQYVYQLLAEIKNEERFYHLPNVEKYIAKDLRPLKIKSAVRPIIIGYGPAGIFAAKRFIDAGIKPLVFEKGPRIEERRKKVAHFFKTGELDENANVQFGEGGAGTFSDAKLTTRIKDPLIPYILDVFTKHGAQPEIKIDAHPHIGTDVIQKVIAAITDNLQSQGAEFHFSEAVKDFISIDGRMQGVITDKGRYFSDYIILASGHSAEDLAKTLIKHQVHITAKDMAIGFRVEHPQSLIDKQQYHNEKEYLLGPAEYFLRYKGERGVYSFCMCPGGIVVPASSKKASIVTNGMSYAARNSGIANSAILVQVPSSDFQSDDPLAGFAYLHELEARAYAISSSYKALAQNIKDYMNHDISPLIFPSSYPLNTHLNDFNKFFPPLYNTLFKEAFKHFDQQIPGFIDQGIMLGPETRSSSPIRIWRDKDGQAVNNEGLYPAGEGSGYGGGIMSCALDGVKTADRILLKLSHNSL